MTQEEDWQPAGLLRSASSPEQQQLLSAGHCLHPCPPPSSSSPHPHPRLNVVYVDTIITDSNGNTSRYDSKEDIAPNTTTSTTTTSHAKATPATSTPRKSAGKGRRHSGPSVVIHGVSSPSSSPSKSSGLRGTHSDSGLGDGVFEYNVLNHHHNWLGVSGGGGGDGAGGLLHPAKSAPSSRPGSPRPADSRSPRSGKKLRTDRRHSTASATFRDASNIAMAQESSSGRLHVPTLALTSDDPSASSNADHPHHTRASSFRESKTSGKNDLLRVDDHALGHVRRNSMPNVSNNLLNVPGSSDTSSSAGDLTDKDPRGVRRVRSFKTTSKGIIVNRGDSFKKKSTHSLMSTGSTVTDSDTRARGGSHNGQLDYGGDEARAVAQGGPGYFRVCMMGAAGVGKTSMAHQFLTSDYVDHDDTDETPQMTVTVLLDGEESTIEFIDPPDRNVIQEGLEQLLDAFVVVFAINDHDSFHTAQQLVRYLRVDYGTDRAILLVANKIDLVRKRKVTADEARTLATTFDCKYAETSAALNHHVDELLVGIITQIRLQLSIPFTTILFPNKDPKSHKSKKALCKGPKGFFYKLFRRGGSRSAKKDRGVENLMD